MSRRSSSAHGHVLLVVALLNCDIEISAVGGVGRAHFLPTESVVAFVEDVRAWFVRIRVHATVLQTGAIEVVRFICGPR